MQVPVQQIILGLGGDRFINRPIKHEFDLIELIQEGIPMESVAFLQNNFGLTNKEMSHMRAWDMISNIGDVDEVDEYIAKLIVKT